MKKMNMDMDDMKKMAGVSKSAAKAASKATGKPTKVSVSTGGFDHHDSMKPYMDPNRKC